MFASLNALQSRLQMCATGRDDAHHLDFRMREKSPRVGGMKGDLVGFGKRGSFFCATPQHTGQSDVMRCCQGGNGFDVIVGNHADADQTKADPCTR